MFDWKIFVKAGRAVFTVENTLTGNRFTYKVNKHKEKDLWFVLVLCGPDNMHDYKYIGAIFDKDFRLTKRSYITHTTSQSFDVFKWLNSLLNSNQDLPNEVNIYHEGRCGICGRVLTVPESIECGFGPICIAQPGNHIPLETARQIQKLFKLSKELNHESVSSNPL